MQSFIWLIVHWIRSPLFGTIAYECRIVAASYTTWHIMHLKLQRCLVNVWIWHQQQKLQLQLHMQLQHPTSDWWHLQHERRRLECKIQLTCLSTDTCKPHTHSKMHMWVSYQFHVQSTWQTGHTTPHRLTHLPTRPLFIFRVAQEHRNLLKARCTAMAQNPGPLKQMSAWFLHMRQHWELQTYIYVCIYSSMEKPWRDSILFLPQDLDQLRRSSCVSCPVC